jgi:hypothetical protein
MVLTSGEGRPVTGRMRGAPRARPAGTVRARALGPAAAATAALGKEAAEPRPRPATPARPRRERRAARCVRPAADPAPPDGCGVVPAATTVALGCGATGELATVDGVGAGVEAGAAGASAAGAGDSARVEAPVPVDPDTGAVVTVAPDPPAGAPASLEALPRRARRRSCRSVG